MPDSGGDAQQGHDRDPRGLLAAEATQAAARCFMSADVGADVGADATAKALSALELAARGYRRTRRGLWVFGASGHYGPTIQEAVIDEAHGLAALRIFQDIMVLEIDSAVELARRFPGARYGSGRYGGSSGIHLRVPLLYFGGRPIRPARALMDAQAGERVHYRNGRTFDLRLKNLLIWPPRPAAPAAPADGPVTAD